MAAWMGGLVPLRCSEEEFVCGAEGPEAWLAQRFEDYIRDIDVSFEPDLVEVVPTNPLYGLVASRDSALLVRREHADGTWCGAPTEGLDEQCFTAAGFAAHLSAWRLGVERGLVIDTPEVAPEVAEI